MTPSAVSLTAEREAAIRAFDEAKIPPAENQAEEFARNAVRDLLAEVDRLRKALELIASKETREGENAHDATLVARGALSRLAALAVTDTAQEAKKDGPECNKLRAQYGVDNATGPGCGCKPGACALAASPVAEGDAGMSDTCELCGQRVRVHAADEGTCSYIGVDAAELAAVRGILEEYADDKVIALVALGKIGRVLYPASPAPDGEGG